MEAGSPRSSSTLLWRASFEAVVAAPIDRVWEATGDFAGIHRWAPSVVSACALLGGQPNTIGCVRRCDGADGGFLGIERLLEMDESHHRYKYIVQDSIIPGLAGYISTFQLTNHHPKHAPNAAAAAPAPPPHDDDHVLDPAHGIATRITWSYQIPPIASSSPQDFQALIFGYYHQCITDLHKYLTPS